jgi:deazaflavin-dependent oxidoreductase (nitroreductase family)
MSDFNEKIIEEFRAHGGKVGGYFEGQPMLLLHHRSAKTGQERVNPLVYLRDGDSFAVFGTNAGRPRDPYWVGNVAASPGVEIEVGDDRFDARARVAGPEERARLWERQKGLYPQFAEYEQTAGRPIPVVVLETA